MTAATSPEAHHLALQACCQASFNRTGFITELGDQNEKNLVYVIYRHSVCDLLVVGFCTNGADGRWQPKAEGGAATSGAGRDHQTLYRQRERAARRLETV